MRRATVLVCGAAVVLQAGLCGAEDQQGELAFSAALAADEASVRRAEFSPGEPIAIRVRLENRSRTACRVVAPSTLGMWFDLRDADGNVLLRLPTTVSPHRRLTADECVLLGPGQFQSEVLDLTLSVALPPQGQAKGHLVYSGAGQEHGFWVGELRSEEIRFVLRPAARRQVYDYLGLMGAKWWHAEMYLDLAFEMYATLAGQGRPELARLGNYYLGVVHEQRGNRAEAVKAYEMTLQELPGSGAAILAEAALGRLRSTQDE